MSTNVSARYERRISVADEDHRSPGRRDHDRVVFSRAVQRLAGVTQVVSALEGFAFHNRLTHTLEMAQLGRRFAEKLVDEVPQDRILEIGGLDPDVVETACLVHDVGHPPFGHTAESELHALLVSEMPDGFEGNAQSLRVVTTLEPYRPTLLGLNLTRASLRALLKYPFLKATKPAHFPKWGVYETDRDTLAWVADGAEITSRSAEAQLVEIVDDIAYSVHDVDDFFRCHLIPLDRILLGASDYERFIREAFQSWTRPPDELATLDRGDLAQFFQSLLRRYVKVEGEYRGTQAQRAALRLATSDLVKYFRDSLRVKSEPPWITLGSEERIAIALLREVTRFYVHRNAGLVAQQHGSRRVIRLLFDTFRDHAERRDFAIFPEQFRDIISDDRILERYSPPGAGPPHLRLISDTICSLTDGQAILMYNRLTGAGPGVIFDPVGS